MTDQTGELAAAVNSGDLGRVRALLYARPELINMDRSESNEHRPLHYAVLRRDLPMVRLLMQAGADARKGIWPHRDATSAFVLARDREYHDIVAIIESEEEQRGQERRADVAKPDINGLTAMTVRDAVASGDAENARRLIAGDPSVLKEIRADGGLLTLAVKHGQLDMVRLLLQLGADVDERTTLAQLETPVATWGMPLWHAALANNLPIAQLLLDSGADPNANVYASGWPLRNAWSHPDGAVKRLLLAGGAKRQPYMVAEAHDVSEAARLLATEPSENLAYELLWSAADHRCSAIVALALPHVRWPAADPRWHWVLIQPIRGAGPDNSGNAGSFESMALLLRSGVDPNVARFGQTALHFAAGHHGPAGENARARFAALLLDHRARLNVRDDLLQSTPLAWACRWGRKDLAEVLVARGVDVAEPDAEPWATPQSWAKKMNRPEISRLLESASNP